MATRRTVDIKEVASELGISKNAAYEAAKRGEIPTLQIGRRKLVPGDWLDRKLDALRNDDKHP